MLSLSPKRRVDIQALTCLQKLYCNHRRSKRVTIWGSIIIVATILVRWNLAATWPDVNKGDTVRIKYGIWLVNSTFIEESEDLVVYIDLSYSPLILYTEVSHAKVMVQRYFAVPACSSSPCENYEGFISGAHVCRPSRAT